MVASYGKVQLESNSVGCSPTVHRDMSGATWGGSSSEEEEEDDGEEGVTSSVATAGLNDTRDDLENTTFTGTLGTYLHIDNITTTTITKCTCENQRGNKAKANQTTQHHPGQLFFPEKGKKSCPRWDSNPRHFAL